MGVLLAPDAPPELIAITEAAVTAFAKRDFDEAKRRLDELEGRFGKSGFVDVYREAMAEIGDVFDGVLRLHVK